MRSEPVRRLQLAGSKTEDDDNSDNGDNGDNGDDNNNGNDDDDDNDDTQSTIQFECNQKTKQKRKCQFFVFLEIFLARKKVFQKLSFLPKKFRIKSDLRYSAQVSRTKEMRHVLFLQVSQRLKTSLVLPKVKRKVFKN